MNVKTQTPASASQPSPNAAEAQFSFKQLVQIIFQLLVLAVSVIFGAWAIKSYNAALDANRLGEQANSMSSQAQTYNQMVNQANDQQVLMTNQLALLQLCYGILAGSVFSPF